MKGEKGELKVGLGDDAHGPEARAPFSAPFPVEALPAMLRGVDDVVAQLGASEAFVRTWMDMPEGGAVPAMPSYQLLGNRVFPTARVLRWMDEFFLFGAGGRPVSQRPAERRGAGKRRKKN